MIQEDVDEILSGSQTRVGVGWDRRGEARWGASQLVGIGQRRGLALQELFAGGEFLGVRGASEDGFEGGANEVGIRRETRVEN